MSRKIHIIMAPFALVPLFAFLLLSATTLGASGASPISETVILHTQTVSKALSTRFRPIGETTSITSLAVLILSRWLSRSASGRKSYFYASFLNATVFRESAAGPKLHESLLMYFSIHPEPKHPKWGRLIAVENE